MRTIALQRSASVTLNSSGNGSVSIGPNNPGEMWTASIVSVSCATNVKEAECQIYVGNTANQSTYVDGTLSGSTGDSTGNVIQPLYPGQYVIAVWTGGDSGTTAVMNITGTRQVP